MGLKNLAILSSLSDVESILPELFGSERQSFLSKEEEVESVAKPEVPVKEAAKEPAPLEVVNVCKKQKSKR